ncbi:MAG: hypothetical protein IT538_00530 [Variibacter sp.]|nr:hypothetical protein [Variibacter sp.]
MDEFVAVTDSLLAVLAQETELVRAGRLAEASALAATKSEAAGGYLVMTQRLKARPPAQLRAAPQVLDQLQRRQQHFRDTLQLNLAVLATAHAVAEGLIRGAASEAARQSAPQGYGARGHAIQPRPRSAQPVALSRAY